MANRGKYGSFIVNVKGEDIIVNPLTQKELAEGWQLVVPRVKSTQITLSYGNKKVKKSKKNYKIFRINISQLPEHLWNKLYPKYEDGQYSHSVARDNMYLYIVKDTPVDKEIVKLYNYLNYKHYTESKLQDIRNLLNILEDNNINGWIVLRAKMALNR
jgi:hypothetical protein